ncbi:type I restriction endonuclease [uncultured Paenibacillus sp.]|jgi:predicted type IV restriction endonuclease|uniref:type I restriction endonuclease n=1 Tax=uncultured Paenibacillus sp. TaxID=227322 RepID=UPI0015AB6A97|nr:type I restriction endonuclease [uncultured Paenibacillus sp.]
MEFQDQIRALAKRVQKLKDNIQTEEATKTSIIMPFFQTLNYDVFNPEEFIPEFTADVGIKKGEKVDYAIMKDKKPMILIEAKSIHEELTKHDSQLFRYFGTTEAKFAILTNGIIYKFYTDLEEQNKMDATPFFEFNLFDIRDHQLAELSKFKKETFDVESINTTAAELKYTNEIKRFLKTQWENPTDDFVTAILSEVYPGKKTKQVIEKFNGIVKRSFKEFVNDMLNDKLQTALANTNLDVPANKEATPMVEETESTPEVITTPEELEGYITIRVILRELVDPTRVHYRDNLSYFNILLDNNIRKWICRLYLNSNNKSVQFNDENKTTINLDNISDLITWKDKIIETTRKFL